MAMLNKLIDKVIGWIDTVFGWFGFYSLKASKPLVVILGLFVLSTFTKFKFGYNKK